MELMKADNNIIIQDKPQQPQQQMQQKEEEEEEEHHFHVLAVDDSVIDRKLLEKLLKVSSYQVTCVDSVDKALEYLGLLNSLDPLSSSSSLSSSTSTSTSSSSSQSSQQEGLKVNLIMTDFCMPGMSGYDLLKRVKGSSWKHVPVVVMSSENVPSRISMCLEGGAEEFLLKPLQLSDIDKIQAYLVKSSLHDNSCTNMGKNDLILDNDDKDDEDGDEDDDVGGDDGDDNNTDKNNCNVNEDNNSNNNNNSFSKRKAAISSDATERRPKMKGLPVVV